jgi:phenylalanyl-tRNA synthetase beta chain
MKVPVNWLKKYVKTNKSAKEIADSFTALGLLLDKPVEKINGEEVLDLEHRMDRSDWLSIIGCARDFAAFENTQLKYPEFYTKTGKDLPEEEKIIIKVECPDLVHRFNTRVFKNIKVGPSPSWLKTELEAYGIPSINNIVDITNYVMVELGQPMHAQDIAKLEKKEIIIRKAKKGESVTTLLGETVNLDENVFVLTQNNKPTVIGGVVGGIYTGVDEATTEIVLDAGNYSQVNVRKTSRKLKILNETVMRYDKFLHPRLTQVAIERATELILEIAGGDYYMNEDWYPKKWPLKTMKLRYSRLEQISGINFEKADVLRILKALEYKIVSEKESALQVEVPYFRTDVEVEDDIVADVLRISDYRKIVAEPIDNAPPSNITPKIYDFENKLRDIMASLGAHEHITDPLIQKDEGIENQVVLQNALTSDKSALRTSIEQTLRPVMSSYTKHKLNEISLFEIGRTYHLRGSKKEFDDYSEERTLLYIYNKKGLSLQETNVIVKQSLSNFLKQLGIDKYDLNGKGNRAEIIFAGNSLGNLTLDSFELKTSHLMEAHKDGNIVKTAFSHVSKEDISVIMDENESVGPIITKIYGFKENVQNAYLVEEYSDNKTFGENKKSVLLRIESSEKLDMNELSEYLESETDVSVRKS